MSVCLYAVQCVTVHANMQYVMFGKDGGMCARAIVKYTRSSSQLGYRQTHSYTVTKRVIMVNYISMYIRDGCVLAVMYVRINVGFVVDPLFRAVQMQHRQ